MLSFIIFYFKINEISEYRRQSRVESRYALLKILTYQQSEFFFISLQVKFIFIVCNYVANNNFTVYLSYVVLQQN